jgi:hypothetical protein
MIVWRGVLALKIHRVGRYTSLELHFIIRQVSITTVFLEHRRERPTQASQRSIVFSTSAILYGLAT